MQSIAVRCLPAIGMGIFFILAALRFQRQYSAGAAGTRGFGPSQVAGAVLAFSLGVLLLVWSFLAVVGIAPTK